MFHIVLVTVTETSVTFYTEILHSVSVSHIILTTVNGTIVTFHAQILSAVAMFVHVAIIVHVTNKVPFNVSQSGINTVWLFHYH